MIKHNSDKIGKRIFGIGGSLSLVVFLILAFVSWSQYDIWGKIEFTMFGFFITYLLGYSYLNLDSPSESKVLTFSHPIPNIIFAILMLLIGTLMVVYILSSFHVRFPYTNILQFFTLLLFDVSSVFVIPKVVRHKMMKRQSAT